MADETWREETVSRMKREDTIYDKLYKYNRICNRIIEERKEIEIELSKLEDQINQEQVGTDEYYQLLKKIQRRNGRIIDLNNTYEMIVGKTQDLQNKKKAKNRAIAKRFRDEEEK